MAFAFDGRNGVLSVSDETGRKTTIHYFMRYDVAYMGKIRKITDEKGRDLAGYRYDPETGNLTRYQDRFGNHMLFEYDDAGHLAHTFRRAAGSSEKQPLVSYAHDADGNATAVSRLDASGSPVATATARYDASGQLIAFSSGTGRMTATYTKFGYPASLHDGFGQDFNVAYDYYLDGQIASATVNGETERFLWDGLALIARGNRTFVNEPAPTGGNPIASGGRAFLNDMLGSTVGIHDGKTKCDIPVAMTLFGENSSREVFFTGKPKVQQLGYVFIMRLYRSDHGKWLSCDPVGYPDGWNSLTYCQNFATNSFDPLGTDNYDPAGLTDSELSQLSRALRLWISDASTIGYPLVATYNYTYTLSFLSRYLRKLGDQTIAYSIIKDESEVQAANSFVRSAVLGGTRSFKPIVIPSISWSDSDLRTSLGSVAINYRVWEYQIPVFSGWTTVCVVEGTIEDKYDFHSTANEYFPGLSLEGAVVGWNGGDYVTDNWMKQLNDAGYASEFITTIKWQFSVVLPE